ncbi:uracil-DNA glycosylase family protein [Lutibacter sp. A80]|uniref:uracil-DNA glycosylase family protein n=1 Tax=Lutibacter sp. A80 TaxID=2918453 RepID=UPI001F0531F8|nr:uracil-DNA glycosylase family protein [Lutibacter sp. A80]UMB62005.1 uracil-DNA glycosylase family protein [Lutibacter sp. A80]
MDFIHKHPYQPYIPKNTKKLIVGTLPPPRFYNGILKDGDVDFCYGSIDGQLWKILDKIFNLNLKFENTELAIQQRKTFLENNNIGICDIVESCVREKIDASDIGMKQIQLRDLIFYLQKFPKIETLLLTGGNSKNGPEFHLRKLLKTKKIELIPINLKTPRIHQFYLKKRIIKSVSLTAPSGAANRAIGSNPAYKILKKKNPNFNTFDFRVLQYKKFFFK